MECLINQAIKEALMDPKKAPVSVGIRMHEVQYHLAQRGIVVDMSSILLRLKEIQK